MLPQDVSHLNIKKNPKENTKEWFIWQKYIIV